MVLQFLRVLVAQLLQHRQPLLRVGALRIRLAERFGGGVRFARR